MAPRGRIRLVRAAAEGLREPSASEPFPTGAHKTLTTRPPEGPASPEFLVALLHGELRRAAAWHLRRERPNHPRRSPALNNPLSITHFVL